MNYNETMIKKLFRTKKSLSMPAPVSPYKDLPEFLRRGKPFAMWDRLHIDYSFFVNIPGKNENEPGTLKIMFYGNLRTVSYGILLNFLEVCFENCPNCIKMSMRRWCLVFLLAII